jgi:molybdopterin molybdotransferase
VITFQDALARLLGGVRPIGAERVALGAALGRVLAQDIAAGAPMPAFDHSAMDGYALASSDLSGTGPWRLPVRGESAAGGPLPALASGSACRIFTGARLPAGADTVVPQEDAERQGDSIALSVKPQPGAWMRLCGADLQQGSVALKAGTRLHPGSLALAAALDRPHLLVARRPIVTVLCSGDELRAPGEPGASGTIAESNGVFVAACGAGAGAIVRIGPFVKDDLDGAARAVAEGLAGSDVLVTIGGVSVGDRDVMKPALEKAGVTLDFWRVAIKPGKPLAVGRSGSTHVLGLPGNPASASLTWLLFGMPLVRALQGDASPVPARLIAQVIGSLRRAPGREEFLRATLKWEAGGVQALLLPNQASGAVTSFAQAEALVVVPAHRDRIDSGEQLEAIRIAGV